MKGNTRALQKQDLRPISLGATTLARCDEFGGATTLARPQSLARQGEARARQGEARGRGAALSFPDASEEAQKDLRPISLAPNNDLRPISGTSGASVRTTGA